VGARFRYIELGFHEVLGGIMAKHKLHDLGYQRQVACCINGIALPEELGTDFLPHSITPMPGTEYESNTFTNVQHGSLPVDQEVLQEAWEVIPASDWSEWVTQAS